MEFNKKVDFADNIVYDSSLEDIEIFIKKLIQQFHIKLMDSGIETISKATLQLSHSPARIIVTNKSFRSHGRSDAIYINLGWNCVYDSFMEYKRYQKSKIIGSIANITIQNYVMVLVAHEYSHTINQTISMTHKAYGKEFQQIYTILRQYTNSFLPKDVIMGNFMSTSEYTRRLVETGNLASIYRGDSASLSNFISEMERIFKNNMKLKQK